MKILAATLFLLVLVIFIIGMRKTGEWEVDGSAAIGVVTLNVNNLTQERDFYSKILKFDVLEEDEQTVLIGKKKPLIRLVLREDLEFPERSENGLYHIALLFSSRAELSRVLYNVLLNYPDSYMGSANHSVSEAFYFTDPEGNGIELYFDIDKSKWKWKDQKVYMETIGLDVRQYIEKNYGEDSGDVTVRHVHLKGSDLSKAKDFYHDLLGFKITNEMDGAVFFAAGDYHHNIAVNTWQSLGSKERTESLGLGEYEIIASSGYIEKLKARLLANNYLFSSDTQGIILKDPFGNVIRIRIK